MRANAISTLAAMGLAALSCREVVAGEIHVPRDFRDIQAAIDAAAPGQSVVVADGVWTGRGNANITFRGKAITVRSANGPAACIIDAQRGGSAFVFNAREGAASVIEGFTLRGASQSAVQCLGAGPTIRGCILNDNWNGLYGGGLFADSAASPLLIDCIVSNNLAGMGAGAAIVRSRARIERCEFFGNRTDLFGGGGVAATDAADVTIIDSVFHENQAIGFSGNGSGVLISRATGLVVNSLFYRNTATFIGGGLSSVLSTTRIVNCTVSNNSAADFGSGLYIDGNTSVENSIFWNNIVDEIYVAGGSPTVRYSTIRGGWGGEGTRSDDPRFVDEGGDNYRLSAASSAIDAGDNGAVPQGIDVDLDGNPRFIDDPAAPDTGRGTPPIVDIGAYERQSGGGFVLAIVGDCPGRVRLQWFNAAPGRPMGIVFARSTGSFRIVGGPCAGTRLGLGANQLQLVTVIGTGGGSGQISATIGTNTCRGHVQLVVSDGSPCSTSNVVQLP